MSNRLHIILVLGIFLSCMLASCLYSNRSFFLGFSVSIAAMIWVWFGNRLTKRQVTMGVACLAAMAAVLVIYVEPDSSSGRLLIYKISSKRWLHNWFSGIGFGNFKTTYPYYQADYFASGAHTQKELLLADNTHYAFNDYYQFVIETGIAGVCILVVGAFLLLGLMRAAYRSIGRYSPVLNISAGVLIAILTAAFFTYTFYHYRVFAVASILCVGVIGWVAFSQRKARWLVPVALIPLISLTLFWEYRFNLNRYHALGDLRDIRVT